MNNYWESFACEIQSDELAYDYENYFELLQEKQEKNDGTNNY